MTRNLAALLLFVTGMTVPLAAGAQNPQTAPPGVQPAPVAPPNAPSPPPEKLAPGALDSQTDNQTLSDRLSQQHGTLHPPTSVDPGIAVTPPAHTQGSMPVIPPPGSPGGDRSVVPK